MEAAPDLVAALAAARAVVDRFHWASDEQLIADAETIESLGRVVDALRLGAAAQLEHRSRKTRGEESLAFRRGARDGVELVQHVAAISRRSARRRVGLGAALEPRVALTGELLPGRYPALADAVAAGTVGVDAAHVIVSTALEFRRRVSAEDLDTMVTRLTEAAQTLDADTVRGLAHDWALLLDADGAEPRHRDRVRKRSLKIGATAADGTTGVSLVLTPEHLAVLQELLQAARRNAKLVRTTPGGDEHTDETDPEWREETGPDDGDPRSRAQQDLDTLFDVIGAGTRAQQDGTVSTAVTHEVVVVVTAAEVEAREGQAWTAGVMADLPMPVVERTACIGGVRLLVTGDRGEPLYLSRAHRVFSAAQKKALTAAAGGRCQYPGCRTPSPFLEAHHAQWYHRDGGETHVDNGIMLCSYHHHLIHAKGSPVEIRRDDGDLAIVPKGWRGPCRPHQRRQRGPTADPALAERRRARDPARSPWYA